MPTAEDPEPRPSDGPQDDPFAGLVLDEEFVRAATVKEQSGRARMLAARWQRQPPEAVPYREAADRPARPGARPRAGRFRNLRGRIGKRWQGWLIVAVVGALVIFSLRLQGRSTPSTPPPTRPAKTATPTAPPSTTPGPEASTTAPPQVAKPVVWRADAGSDTVVAREIVR